MKQDESDVLDMLKSGKTQTEIADAIGVSKQAVNAFLHAKKRERKTRLAMFGDIPYRGIREFMLTTPKMTLAKLGTAIYKTPSSATRERLRRLVRGDNTYVTVKQLKRLMAFTGRTFEDLFDEEIEEEN